MTRADRPPSLATSVWLGCQRATSPWRQCYSVPWWSLSAKEAAAPDIQTFVQHHLPPRWLATGQQHANSLEGTMRTSGPGSQCQANGIPSRPARPTHQGKVVVCLTGSMHTRTAHTSAQMRSYWLGTGHLGMAHGYSEGPACQPPAHGVALLVVVRQCRGHPHLDSPDKVAEGGHRWHEPHGMVPVPGPDGHRHGVKHVVHSPLPESAPNLLATTPFTHNIVEKGGLQGVASHRKKCAASPFSATQEHFALKMPCGCNRFSGLR